MLQTIEQYRYIGIEFQAIHMPLNKGHGIEASCIIVHLYDILVINTHPQLHIHTVI